VKLVVNASPLILLAAADRLSLLRDLADEVVVPAAVLDELEAGEPRDQAAADVRAANWITLGDPLPVDPVIAAWDLGAGETSVLSLAKEQADSTCVLDDRAARTCARVLGLPCVGTLGLILAAKEAGRLPAARPVLEEMIGAGFYLAGEILEQSLRDAGE
jgi:predicted nucleic acid-binding protein